MVLVHATGRTNGVQLGFSCAPATQGEDPRKLRRKVDKLQYAWKSLGKWLLSKVDNLLGTRPTINLFTACLWGVREPISQN